MRSSFGRSIVATAVAAACLLAVLETGCTAAAPHRLRVYVGGRAKGKGGIHRGHLDLATGAITLTGKTTQVPNPSFLAMHPNGRFLYAVNEVAQWADKPTGAVSAFAIDPGTGALTLLNQGPTGGRGPCHLVVDPTGRNVLAANYGSGSACVLRIGPDGRLGKQTAFVQHEGHSVDPRRQTSPHAHAVNLDAANRFAFVTDLGLDQVLIYRFDAAAGTFAANDPPFVAADPGAGPRHMAFHPSGKYAYVVNELTSSVTAMAYDAAAGRLTPIHTAAGLPKDFDGKNSGAEIEVHPSGTFVYASMRGHDSIAVFAIDPATGRLTPAGHQSTLGQRPRHFSIDPTGTYLLAANQASGTVVTFRIDAATGALAPTGHSVEVAGPLCVLAAPGS